MERDAKKEEGDNAMKEEDTSKGGNLSPWFIKYMINILEKTEKDQDHVYLKMKKAYDNTE